MSAYCYRYLADRRTVPYKVLYGVVVLVMASTPATERY